jgi:ketose-bisphosphate aldolase
MSMTPTSPIVEQAYKQGYAIPAFNTQGGDYHICRAIVEAAEEESSPIILMAYDKNLAYVGYDGFFAVAGHLAGKASVPVGLHLDHATELESIQNAIDAGFTSVMIDYSTRSITDNIDVTKRVQTMIGDRSISVETEIGELQRITDDLNAKPQNLVDPDTVAQYLASCRPDMLAIGIGNAHGFYKGKPNIRIDLLKQINAIDKNVPLVLHGSTGIEDEVVRECIANGVAKVNFGTQIRWNFLDYVQQAIASDLGKEGHIWKVNRYAMNRLKDDIRHIIRLCGSNGKANGQ